MMNLKNQLLAFVVVAGLASCGKNNTEAKHADDGKATAVAVNAYPGKNRVKLSFQLKDKNVTRCEVFWSSKTKSQQVDIGTPVNDSIHTIIDDLAEGNYSFEVYTYDKNNNAAIAKAVTTVYGDKFTATLATREPADIMFITGKVPFIEWPEARRNEVAVEVLYTDDQNKTKRVLVKGGEVKSNLPAYKPNTVINYRSLYLPAANAIDTFYSVSAEIAAPVFYSSELVSHVMNRSGLASSLTSENTITLHEGVIYSNMSFKKQNGEPINLHLLKVDLNNPNVAINAMLPNNQKLPGLQSVRLMAEAKANAGQQVLAAVNADFFESNGTTLGPVYMNGEGIKTTSKANDLNFFGIKKDGTPTVGLFSATPVAQRNELQEAVGGGIDMIVAKGIPCNNDNINKEPRTMAGYAGKVVYLGVVDGRKPAISVGMTIDQIGLIMKSVGATDAINLDGGGSSTMVLKNAATGTYGEVNVYSDARPRSVASSLAVVLK